MPPTIAATRLGVGSVLLALLNAASAGCAGAPDGPPRALQPVSAVPITTSSPDAGALPAERPNQLHAVAHVVRHWFGRYSVRYSDVVRIETLIAHVDSPTRADVFVVATFTDAGSVDSHGRPIPKRPKEGRYYRSVQLERRAGRWHIESVQPT